jgi:hypothetical protein
MTEIVKYYMERDSDIYVAYLAHRKAFNNVWYFGLLYKLYNLTINGRGWCLLSNSFRESNTRILYEGELSKKFIGHQGVGKGRVLASWFFLLMIDKLI